MPDVPLPDLEIFLAVANRGSFARAAAHRGLSRSAISHAIRMLEERLGVRLFHRTTRSVTLTEVGRILKDRLEPALAEVDDAIDALNVHRNSPMGTLRLNVPHNAIRVLSDLLVRFAVAYPDIRIEVMTDDRLVDIVREGFDAGVRFGERIARDMIATPLGPMQRFACVASPAYLARHPAPAIPHDLTTHMCIRRRFPGGALYDWEFEKDGQALEVATEGAIIVDDHDLMMAFTRAGFGLALMFEDQVAQDLAAGSLVRVLEDWCQPFAGYHLYYPSRRMAAPLRAFLDFVRRNAR